MSLYQLGLECFNVAAPLYLLGSILYAFHLVKKTRWNFYLAPMIVGVAFAAHTMGLTARWIEGGLYRPPWTNLYESLVYFSWGLALIGYTVDLKYRLRLIGVFLYPLVFTALGLAYLTPAKTINPLVPALQSWWILAHSCLAAFAYSGFLVAAMVALLYLIKVQVSRRAFGIGAALLGGSAVALVGWYGTFGALLWFVALTLGYGWALLLFLGASRRPSWLGLGRMILLISVLFHGGGLAWLSPMVQTGIFAYALLMTCGLIVVFLTYVQFRSESLSVRLPEAAWLDNLTYKINLFSFPIMTLILITGAIWAHEAWGRYWGWDPKETTALMTWLLYAAYLHMRMVRGWSGTQSAFLCLLGFISVIFTFLGTNILLSGLHSYGAPQ